ncbi:porin [Deferribacter abyssi]|uniref:porin n=1 Tax=Deferribacter abyssi TaxID=213806 RepID=UPI003C16B775
MKKFIVAMLVLLFAFSVYAEERLKMYGQLRVRGFYKENFSDYNNDNDSDKYSYFDQRVRVGFKLKVADDVSVNIRMDLAEDTWGARGQNTIRTSATQTNYALLDKAYVEVNKDMYMLRFGQQYFGFGDAIVVDHIGTGFLLNLKLPVTVTLAYTKIDERAKTDDYATNDADKDKDLYGIQAAYKTDVYAVKAFYAIIDDKAYDGDKPQAIGVQANFNVGTIAIDAELDYFFGKDDNTNTDYVGTQLYVNPSVKLDVATVGAHLYYAKGTDKSDENQIYELTDFGSFLPTDIAGMKGVLGIINDYAGANVFAVDDNAGSLGGDLYAVFKPMKNITAYVQAGYLTPEEDSVTPLNSLTFAGGGVTYGFATNTAIQLSAGIVKPDFDGNISDDVAKHVSMRLYTNF